MEILKLELKNFGKFSNEQIAVGSGIHIFYGENEAGKTTIHTFIKSMLFGMERGKGRASINDTFSRYEPWENSNYYAGILTFSCGDKIFRLERNFDKYAKGAVLICEDDGEELSVEDGDLHMLLSGLLANQYEDTLCIGQLHAKTSQLLAQELKNYAANYYSTGDSDIDLAATLNLLRQQKKDIDKEVRLSMEQKQRQREELTQQASYVWRDIHSLEEELEDVQEELAYRAEQEEEQALEEGQDNGLETKRVIDELRPPKWRIHPLEILGILAVIVLAFVLIARPWNYLVAIIIALAGGIYIWNRMKEGKKKIKTPPEIILEEITPEEELESKEKLLWEQEHLSGELKEKQVQYDNIQEQLEELDEFNEEYKAQDKKRKSILLAADRLEELSQDMQARLGTELNTRASKVIMAVTNGKYTRLIIDEDLHMSLTDGESGRKVNMEQVSQGTLEQIYLALRIAAGELLHEERYPVILDDTFVFYDDKRLANTLQYLAHYKGQVILFTCQKREMEALDELGVSYTVTRL